MDEYTYDEDFDDIVPSQDAAPLHNNKQPHSNDDTDIQQPSKRVKTAHEGDASNITNQPPDTQLTQVNDDVRKIPGPAGSLPPIHVTVAPAFPPKAMVLANQTDVNMQQDGLLIQSRLHKKKVGASVGMQDEYTTDFTRGPWLVMLQHSELPPFGATPSLLKHSIGHILENRRTKKIPRLVALVKAVVPTDADFKVTLRDPTGEIDGALQRKAMELHPSIISGAVIVLEQVSVFCPSPVSHYLNIVSKNIAHVYTPSSSELSAAKVEYKRLTGVGYSPQSIYDLEQPPDPPSPKKPKPPPPSRNKRPPTPSPTPAKPKSNVWKPGPRGNNSPYKQVKKTVVVNPPLPQAAHPELPTSGSRNIGEFLVPKAPSTSPGKDAPTPLHTSPNKNTNPESSRTSPLQIDSSQRQRSDPPQQAQADIHLTSQSNNLNTSANLHPNPPQSNAKKTNFFSSLYPALHQTNDHQANNPTNTASVLPNPSNLSHNFSNDSSNNSNNFSNNVKSSNTPSNNSYSNLLHNPPSNHQPNQIPIQTQNQANPPPNQQSYNNTSQNTHQFASQQNTYSNGQNNNNNNTNSNFAQNFPQQGHATTQHSQSYNQSNQENLQNQQNQFSRQQKPGPPKPIPQFSAQSQSTLRNGNTKGNDNMTNFSRNFAGRKFDSLSANPSFQTTNTSPGPKPPNSLSPTPHPSNPSTSLPTHETNAASNGNNNENGSGLNSSLDYYDLLDCEL